MPDLFDALADPTRREILRLLSGRQLPAGNIAARFPQQRPAISKHLAILKRAGLLLESRSAQQRLYSVRAGALDSLRIFLAEIRPPDSQVLQRASAPLQPARVEHPPARPAPKPASRPTASAPLPTAARFDLDFD